MKKVIVKANYLLLMDSKVYLDQQSNKVLCVSDKQVLVFDSVEDFLNDISNMYEYVHKKAKA